MFGIHVSVTIIEGYFGVQSFLKMPQRVDVVRYVEKYESEEEKLGQVPADALASLVVLGLKLSKLEEFTGREKPTVIT